MKNTKKNSKITDFEEFTDDNGKKWIQTSTEDLFSIKELNKIIQTIESEKDSGEIVLARIDFRKVNKEYYDRVMELQEKLKKQNDFLKKLLVEANESISRKNRKLVELIEYIRKLHSLLAYYKFDPDEIKKMDIQPGRIFETRRVISDDVVEEEIVIKRIEYSEVEEVMLDDAGQESYKI